MANQIRYQVGFNVNKSDLNQIKSSLQQLQKVKLDDIMKINKTDINSARDALKSIQDDASKVENALNKAFNTKLNTLNIDKFNKQLSSSNLTIQKVYQSFSRAGTAGQSAFNNLSTQILNTNVQLRQSNKLLDSMATSMANTVKWGITSSVFNNMTRSIQQAYYYAKDLDRSLTNIRIVTGDSADQMQRFATTANNAAKELGRSTLDYTKASLTFYQQGLDDQQVAARTEATLKAQNITGIGTEMADYLTAVWNGFNAGAEEAQNYVDKLAAVADSTASDMGQLATAMSKVASAANSIGVDMDQLNGQIATVIATTRQAPESVGAAFKTIYARINDIQAGTEDAQVSLGTYSGKMAELGFNVLDATGHLKDTGETIEEIGGKWQSLTREQQINLAQTMAGQRQYNNLIALFDNWDKYLQSVNTSMNAQGTLNEKNDRYLESLEAHMQQLGTQAERTYDILFDENAVKSWVDVLDGALGIFNDFISGLGGGTNAFAYFGTTVASIFNKQIAQSIQGVGSEIQRVLANINAFNTKSKVIEQIKSGLQIQYAGEGTALGNTALTAQAEAAQKTLAVQKGLTIEQQKQAVQIQKQIGLETQKIEDLQKQQQKAQQTAQELKQQLEYQKLTVQQIQKKKEFLEEQHALTLQTKNVLDKVDITLKTQTATEQQKKVLAKQISDEQQNIVAIFQQQNKGAQDLENKTKQFQNSLEKVQDYLNGGKTTVDEFNKAWNEVYGVVNKFNNNQITNIAKTETLLQNLGIDTSKLTEEEKKKLAVLLQQNDALAEQGRKTLNLQTLVKGVSAAGMALTSIGGGLSTALADGATAADKLNGRFTAINGTIGALLTMIPGIGPALNIVWQGVSSIGKAILEATGVWDKFEDHFKSAKQKVDELNESISKVNQNNKTKNAQISNLEELVEEYEKLSEKAGDYGIYLDNLTQQEQDRYHQITNSFAEYNDAVIAGYDEQGNAIVKGQDALKDTIEVLKQAKIEADKAALGSKQSVFSGISSKYVNRNQDKIDAINTEIANTMTSDFTGDISVIQGSLQEFSSALYNIDNYLPQDKQNKFIEEYNDKIISFREQLEEAIVSNDSALLAEVYAQGAEIQNAINAAGGTLGFDYLFNDFNQKQKQYLDQIQKLKETKQELIEDAQTAINYTQEDANALIIALQTFDNDLWSSIEDNLKSMGLGTGSLIEILSKVVTEQDSDTSIEEVYNLMLEQAEKYKNLLLNYGDAIDSAQTEALNDIENKISTQKNAKRINQKVVESIQTNFINNDQIQKILQDKQKTPFIIELIKNLYNLDNLEIAFDESGNAVINTVKTQRDKINQEILEIFSDKTGEKIPQQLKDYLSNLVIDEDTLLAIKNAAADPEQVFHDLQSTVAWINNFIQDANREVDVQPIIDKFNKISIAIERIQNGKNLIWQEKGGLAQALNLKPQELAELNTNADWLQKITEKVYTTLSPDVEEQSAARKQAFADLYSDLQELRQAYEQPLQGISGVMQMTEQEYADVWNAIYQKELDALDLSQTALQNWATNRGMIFDGVKENTQKALDAYKVEKNAESLQTLAQTIKDAGDKVDTSSEDFVKLQTQLQLLTGEDWSAQKVVAMLDAIASYTDDGIHEFQTYAQWLDYIKNNGPEPTSQISAVSQYNEDKTNLSNLKGAASSLEKHTELSQDQSQALAQAASIDQQLAAILNNENATSEQILQVVNQTIEAKERELEITKEQALRENQQNLQSAKAALEAFDKNRNGTESAEARQELEQRVNDLYAERVGLLQDLNQIQTPKFDEDIDVQQLEHLSDTIQQIAPQSEQLANNLAEDENAADDLAQAILRFDNACVDVSENYEDWMAALNSGSIQEQVQAMDGLRDAYADLLDLDGDSLSEGFLSSTDNLELMRAAIDGDIDAYNQLMNIAQQDIESVVGITVDDTDFWNAKSEVEAAMDQMNFENIEIGANLDTGNFLTQLEDMVNAAGMTAKQATDYLASMGVDAQVVETDTEAEQNSQALEYNSTLTPNTQTVTDTVLTNDGDQLSEKQVTQSVTSWDQNVEATPVPGTAKKENKAFSLKVISANKSSGGGFKFKNATNGGGSKGTARRSSPSKKSSGSGKPKGSTTKPKTTTEKKDTSTKDRKKGLEDQRDIYHDINIQIQQINRSLNRTQKMQDRLYGKQLLDNLAKQQQLLQKQKVTLKEKQKIQEKDLENQQQTLRNLGVTFDQYNNISNYMSILGQKQAEINAKTDQYNAIVDAYNATTDKEQKEKIQQTLEAVDKEIKLLEDQKKNIESKIKDYDDLRENMEDLKDEIEEATQQQIEIQIKKFRMNVEIRLEMGQAERDWNKFRRQVLERPNYMKSTDFDSIFADATQNQRDLASYFKVGSIGSIQTLTNKLWDTKAAIDQIDKGGTSAIYGDNKALAMDHFKKDLDELMQQLENVEDLIEAIDKAYLDTIDDIQKNFDKQIEDYEFIGDLIDHDIDLLTILYGDKNYDAMEKYYTALEQNNNKTLDSLKKQAAFLKEQWQTARANGDAKAAEKFEAAYKKTIKTLNSQIQESAKIIQQKYENSINNIFDTLDKKISNGKGTDYLSMEWQLMNKNEEQYLDTINSAFAIQETQRKYNRALNETKSIKNQQALKKLMDEQLGILKNKNKLTQYDIDRAEKLLQVEQARIALEQTRSSKTSMRLKRNSQGDYSYEYMADQGALGDAEENLAKAQNDLYNFDKDAYKQNLEDMLSAWKEFLSKRKEILLDNNLTEAQQKERLALLDVQYGEYINGKTEQNLAIRNNLTESAFMDIAAIYDSDLANYQQMADGEKDILMGQLVPMWESGIQQMSREVAGEGGFIPTCQEAFENIDQATKDYKTELGEMAEAAGINLGDVQSGVDELTIEFEHLVEENDSLIERMDKELEALMSLRSSAKGLVSDYNEVVNAAKNAVSALHSYSQAQRQAAAADAERAQTQSSSSVSYSSNYSSDYSSDFAYPSIVTGSSSKSTGSSKSSGSSKSGSSGSSSGSSGSNGILTSSNSTTKKSATPYTPPYKTTVTYIPGRGTVTSVKTGPGTRKIIKKTGKKFDTGGYTGDWNSNEGRLAILHQKELVLNQTDTKNFLNGISILREINSTLNGNMFSMLNGLSSSQAFNSSNDVLEQNVHIDASFPNVNSKKEIEEAFSELVNMAAQRAMRR